MGSLGIQVGLGLGRDGGALLPSRSELLLVTNSESDAGHDVVHLVNVVGGNHAGYLQSPGSTAGPRPGGVAARVAAVTTWRKCTGVVGLQWSQCVGGGSSYRG